MMPVPAALILCAVVGTMNPTIVQDGPQRIVERVVYELCRMPESGNVWLRSGRAWFLDGVSRHVWAYPGEPTTVWDNNWPVRQDGFHRFRECQE